jgi:hypothetical protein
MYNSDGRSVDRPGAATTSFRADSMAQGSMAQGASDNSLDASGQNGTTQTRSGEAAEDVLGKPKRHCSAEFSVRLLASFLALLAIVLWATAAFRPFARVYVAPNRPLSNGTLSRPNGIYLPVDVLHQDATCKALRDGGPTPLETPWCQGSKSTSPSNTPTAGPTTAATTPTARAVRRSFDSKSRRRRTKNPSPPPATAMKKWYLAAGGTLALELVFLAWGTLMALLGRTELCKQRAPPSGEKLSKLPLPMLLLYIVTIVALFLPLALMAAIMVDLAALVKFTKSQAGSVASSFLGYTLMKTALQVG